MKRVTSLLLAVVLMVSVLLAGAVPALATETEATVPEDTRMKASDACIGILKAEEGFSKTPYWDYAQWTVGYGTCCPEDMRAYYTEHGITEEEAETLLRNHLVNVYDDLYAFEQKHSLTFTQNQFDALVLFSYNVGTAWMLDKNGTVPKAIFAGATGNDMIRAFALWCNAGGDILLPLLRRRLCEANIYLNNQYSQEPPENYCYVLYDANGGVSKPKSQGYDGNQTAQPFPVPTYEGYTFDGWYTAKVGGDKVTVLDMSTKSKTLYAHWKDAGGNEVVEQTKYVKVTMTADEVNFRKGPGTNYTILGQKSTGDQMIITETASGSGLRWGKFDGGWIALKYTNYDTAVNDPNCIVKPEDLPQQGQDQQPEQTQPTEPEQTQPTQPEQTQPTEPEQTTGQMGTVRVDGVLNIRSGTSTGHSVVGELKNGDRVEILEQKTVGAMVWGRITKGWISMTYVKLDGSESEKQPENNGSTGTPAQTWTGVVSTSEWLNIRSGAGTNYSVAGYLYPGDKVTITEQKTVGSMTWGKIDRGWISMSYVKLDGTSDSGNTGSNAGTSATTGTVTTNSLRIRSAAGTASTVVGYLNTGAKVQIQQTTSVNGTAWGKIDNGWICMDFVKLDGASGSGSSGNAGNTDQSGSNSQQQTGTVYNCTSYLNVRNGAGTSYAVVAYLYPGDRVTVTEQKSVGSTTWGKTAKGWVSMAYIKLDGSAAAPDNTAQGQVKTVTASCLRVRKTAGASGQIVSYLYYGAKVTIVETATVDGAAWGRTANGWISMQYVQ